MLVPGGPDRALVVANLSYFRQAPFGFIQFLLVGVFEVRDAHELSVCCVAPAVVGATEHRGVALIVAADLHTPVGAGVEKNVDLALSVAAENNRFFAHG